MFLTSLVALALSCPAAPGETDATPVDAFISDIKDKLRTVHDSTATDDDTLALAIEWIRMRDAISEGKIGRRGDFFLGFLQARLDVRPPDWWSKELRRGNVFPQGSATFPCRNLERLWKKDDNDWYFNGLESIWITADGQLALDGKSHRVLLTRSDFDEEPHDKSGWTPAEYNAVAASVSHDVSAIALNCETLGVGGAPHIYCVDSATGKVKWRQPLMNGLFPNIGSSGGVGGAFTQLIIMKERIVVWSGHFLAMTLEVFNKADGKRIATFASSYLDGLHLDPCQRKAGQDAEGRQAVGTLSVGQKWGDAEALARKSGFMLRNPSELDSDPIPEGFYLNVPGKRALVVHKHAATNTVESLNLIHNWPAPKGLQVPKQVQSFDLPKAASDDP